MAEIDIIRSLGPEAGRSEAEAVLVFAGSPDDVGLAEVRVG